MLLALRSLYEPTVIPPPIPPGVSGGGWRVFPPHVPTIGVTVTLRPARGRFRAARLTASGGANVQLFPIVGKFSIPTMDVTTGASVQLQSMKSKFKTGTLTATGVDNDPMIAISVLGL